MTSLKQDLSLFILLLSVTSAAAQESVTPTTNVLPETQPLTLKEPLDVVMVRGITQFAERELKQARTQRTASWLTAENSQAATAAARQELRTFIGAVNPLSESPKIWVHSASFANQVAETSGDASIVCQFLQWDVTEGVTGEASIFKAIPRDASGKELSHANSPLLVLLADPSELQKDNWLLPITLARAGATVACPVLIDRHTELSGHPDIKQTNMTHREYIYRLGFNMGRHVIGYEVERVLSYLNAITTHNSQTSPSKIILLGVGEGAVIAQYVAALAPQQVDAVVLHGYFGPRDNVWQEPIYRNVWKQLTRFGDAEIASLIAPTPLIIEAGQLPIVTGPPEAKPGQAAIAAPGIIQSPPLHEVQQEFARAKSYASQGGHADSLYLVEAPQRICDANTIAVLNQKLGLQLQTAFPLEAGRNSIEVSAAALQAQQQRQISELVRHTQMLLARSDKVRAKLWKDVDRSSIDAWTKQAPEYRELVHHSFIGKLDLLPVAANPRSRKIIDEPTHVGYEVLLDLIPEEQWSEGSPGVLAGGILLLPKDLQKNERRPVVVCQHGLEGIPLDTITLDESQRAFGAYKGFATQLVQRGFIVYAPQNPYRGYHDFRVIQRKSNPLGRSLFSYIIPQHQQTLIWLSQLPYVDANRIGFYGLSYGGKTAVRVPPLLPPQGDVPGYALSICSADFNEWIRKNVSAEDRYSYIYTPEYEIFEWNMGHVANYAELSWLMAPRPFMVERGHDDGVAPDEWVGWEFAKVRRHYDKLGIGELTEIEWFDGPHTINGQGTFRFLHRHLHWPAPK